jgi:2-oxoglutarate ferredoxin oxidoreductase subunit gamma
MVDKSSELQKWIKFAGFGGQGIILAGTALGKASASAGREVLQSQSYGPAARGGACESNVIISEEEIYDLSFEGKMCDVMVCMSQLALDRYIGSLKEAGILIIDEGLVQDTEGIKKNVRVFRIPFTDVAEKKLGRKAVANIIMLGYVLSKTHLVEKEHLKIAILDTIPKGTEELNLKAFELGLTL